MIAYKFVPILVNYSHKLSHIPLSGLSKHTLILDNDGGKTSIKILVKSEGNSKEEAINKMTAKIEKLKLYLKLCSNNEVTLGHANTYGIANSDEDFKKELLYSLDDIKNDSELSGYLETPLDSQQKLLMRALDELTNGDILNAFPKLINWLDENAGKGSSRFCCIRDVCSHGRTDEAVHKVKQDFPDEFDFDQDVFSIDSNLNRQNLNKHLPEVLSHIQKIFLAKYI